MTIKGYTGALILTGETGADLVPVLTAMQQAGMTQDKMQDGTDAVLYQTNSEQGFVIQTCGKTSRQIHDFDGLHLIQIPL